jgi:hypothetical protein
MAALIQKPPPKMLAALRRPLDALKMLADPSLKMIPGCHDEDAPRAEDDSSLIVGGYLTQT